MRLSEFWSTIIVAVISAAATVAAAYIGVIQPAVSRLRPVQLCRLASTDDASQTFDLSQAEGQMVLLSASGVANIGHRGVGARAEIQTRIYINGQVVAQDADVRTGININNESLGASVVHALRPDESVEYTTLSVVGKPSEIHPASKFTCIILSIPDSSHAG